MESQTSATPIVRPLTTERLVPVFRALLADPTVCPVRLDKAATIVGAGDLERLADGSWLVVASDGATAYTVDRAGHTCSCPDYQKREAPCKHGLAVRVALLLERAEAERLDPAIVVEVEDEAVPYTLTPRALAAVPTCA